MEISGRAARLEHLLGGITDPGELPPDAAPQLRDARALLARLQSDVDLVHRYAIWGRAVRAATHAERTLSDLLAEFELCAGLAAAHQ